MLHTPTKINVAVKKSKVERVARKAITFNKDDKIINCLNDLLEIYEGMNEVEVVKLALIELRMKNKTYDRNYSSSIKASKKFDDEDKKRFDKKLKESRAFGHQWLLSKGYSEEQIKNLTEEDLYEIVKNA